MQVQYLIADRISADKIKEFECILLGEVRIIDALLRNHKHIVNIYGHQLSCKWLRSLDGKEGDKLLQSRIIMEYVNGGSLKVDQLF